MTIVAFAVWDQRISPLFDASRNLLVLDVENGMEQQRRTVVLDNTVPLLKAEELKKYGIEQLVCGAISRLFAHAIEDQQIQCIPFVAGDVEQVIHSFLAGENLPPQFGMPGCGRGRHRRMRRGAGCGFRPDCADSNQN